MGAEQDQTSNYKWAWYFFFVMGSFILLVHMLNMLVAIMGDVFARNREVEKQLQLKNKLKFVVDNQWADPFGKEKESIKYIIAAYLVEDDEDDVENIKVLQESIELMKTDQQTKLTNIKNQLRKLKGEYEKKMNQKVELSKFDKSLKKLKLMQEKGDYTEGEFNKRVDKIKNILIEEAEKRDRENAIREEAENAHKTKNKKKFKKSYTHKNEPS
jgi:hypothetical protein